MSRYRATDAVGSPDTGAPIVLTSPDGLLGSALHEALLSAGTDVRYPPDPDDLARFVRRARPRAVVHTGVGAIDDVSGPLAPWTHAPHEVVDAASTVPGCRVLLLRSLSAAARPIAGPRDLRTSSVTELRIGAVYGPGQADRDSLVCRVLDALVQGEAPELDSGTRLFDWIYVDDVVDALALAVTHPRPGSTLDIGRGRVSSVADVVTILAILTGQAVPVRFGAVDDPPEHHTAVADGGATRALGWSPRVHLRDGLERTVRRRKNCSTSLDPRPAWR